MIYQVYRGYLFKGKKYAVIKFPHESDFLKYPTKSSLRTKLEEVLGENLIFVTDKPAPIAIKSGGWYNSPSPFPEDLLNLPFSPINI